jgi:hypothetical protein
VALVPRPLTKKEKRPGYEAWRNIALAQIVLASVQGVWLQLIVSREGCRLIAHSHFVAIPLPSVAKFEMVTLSATVG